MFGFKKIIQLLEQIRKDQDSYLALTKMLAREQGLTVETAHDIGGGYVSYIKKREP